MGFRIELIVEEENEQMAYQLLADAIKKKFKNNIRPYFELINEEGEEEAVTDHELQNSLWMNDKAGMPYD